MAVLRVLLVEDSPTMAEMLSALIGCQPDMRLAGVARSGAEAVEMTKRLNPDVIAMDINLPGIDGFAATKQIMAQCPTPIVIVSATVDVSQIHVSMAALDAGALVVLEKPVALGSDQGKKLASALLSGLRSMAGMKLVRRRGPASAFRSVAPAADAGAGRTGAKVVAIAASTGGPAALGRILTALPKDFPAAVLVVQHIAAGFVDGLASWLDRLGPLRVAVAQDGEGLEPGRVYLAADDCHLGMSRGLRVHYSNAEPIGGFRPAASYLFESVAHAVGANAMGVILTGMGRDGIEGLRAIRAAGGYVVAQDAETSVVNGMPGAAVSAGVVDAIVPVDSIAQHIINRVAGGMANA